MESIRVEVGDGYDVLVGPGALRRATSLLAERGAAILTDSNVEPLHGARLELPRVARLVLPPGEASKSFATLERVLDFLAASALDRASRIVALGGGVIGDLGGLAASLFMRGIDVVQCPTTLLAMTDASVGGKTAVNLAAGKNLAGTFHQPIAVLADTETLATLPEDELRSGLGEVVKSAVIGDGELLDMLDARADSVLARDADALAEIVVRCVRVKARIVGEDEREAGGRAVLNLGHTFGHAFERAAGYGVLPHGEAVAVGIGVALEAARRTGLLADADLPARVDRALARLGLARSIPELAARHGCELATDAVRDAMRLDKKGRRGAPTFVVPTAIGDVRHGIRLDEALVEELLG